jgi:predicted nucleic acid-binding protein
MTPRFGIDTSVLVRLVTGQPEPDFRSCLEALRLIVEDQGGELFASNQVVGEAYVTIQHHYGVSDAETREGLIAVLTSGLVAPSNGHGVISMLEERQGAGLFDRLIADGYSREGMETLTLDRRMSSLPGVQRL